MRVRLARLRCAALPLLLVTACATAPAVGGGTERRVDRALPEPDPTSRATVQGPRALSGVERVVVKLEPTPDGRIKVIEFLSPDLSEAEKAELVEAIERGQLRPETTPGPIGTTWVTTVVRQRR